MEINNWDEIPEENKKQLLEKWFYSENDDISDEDKRKYDELIDEDIDEIFNLAVCIYTMGLNSKLLIKAIRGNFVGRLLDSIVPKNELDERTKILIEEKEEELLAILSVCPKMNTLAP